MGLLKTEHGFVQTPSLVPVATQAAIKTLSSDVVERETKSQILIANTFHLHIKPGETVIERVGGLHSFMNWQRPLMTDSGGFQVFSFGFGSDFGAGKILKYFPGNSENGDFIKRGSQPKTVKITDDGVWFRSPVDGKNLFLGPKESMRIQQALGADIIFAFDECTSPLSTKAYIEKSLARTHAWAKICIEEKKSNQALFGIVQGSKYKDLREKSSRFINELGFDGFGIGGDLGASKAMTNNIIRWSLSKLDTKKPRHLLGIGHLEDIEPIIKAGIDLFDCTAPTHYARRAIAFTTEGKLKVDRERFLKDKTPIDRKCGCSTCRNYKRSYISHLFRAREISAMSLLTIHNLYFFNTFVENIRNKMKEGKI